MSRHRNVRALNYEDDYYDEDDVYGHSVEDNYCISPGTAEQFTFDRDRNVALANYMDEQEVIHEEEEPGEELTQHRVSHDPARPTLSEIDEARLNSCLDEVRSVLGDSVPEHVIVEVIVRHNFSIEGAFNELLNQQEAPKPQREPRDNRRNRSQELDYDNTDSHMNSISGDVVFSGIPLNPSGSLKFGQSLSTSPSVLEYARKIPTIPSGIDNKGPDLGQYKSLIKQLANNSGKQTQIICSDGNANQNSSSSQSLPKPASESKIELHYLSGSSSIKTADETNNNTDLRPPKSSNGQGQQTSNTLCHSTPTSGQTLSLSELAAKHSVEKSPRLGDSLAVLAEAHKAKLLSSPDQMSSKVSSLAFIPSTSPLTKHASDKLSNGDHLVEFSSVPSSISSHQSTDKPLLADLATVNLSSTGLSPSCGLSTSGLTLADLAKKHVSSAGASPLSSKLSSVSPAFGSPVPTASLSKSTGSTQVSGVSASSSSVSPGLSLAQLAEAHGASRSSVTIQKKVEGQLVGLPESGSMLSASLLSNKSDKTQIMLSLSNLVEKHSLVKAKPTAKSANLVEEGKTSESRGDVEAMSTDVQKLQMQTLSLADLIKHKTTTANPLGNHGKGAKVDSQSLEDKVVSDPKLKHIADEIVQLEDDLGEILSLNKDVSFECPKHMLKGPSVIGKSLLFVVEHQVQASRKAVAYKHKGFQYSCQARNCRKKIQEIKVNEEINVFDYKKPSPDDIVKESQKQAFHRRSEK
ncbi:uncharacterized protein LOC127874489 isoform X4 [Dreissena polymorpha]|uniref:uncharacterized protein LOC127874489 isoform X4 n=1 Tax=Dreissena polymorpha TaxID=45954 RepID=UPI0022656C51|nr:uncharacterized protein LOC127874489 isoform X4 [Dreissena polymorpha]